MQQEQNGGDAANSWFRHCMQLVRMAYLWNLSQPPRVGSAIFRMQGAEGCEKHLMLVSAKRGHRVFKMFFFMFLSDIRYNYLLLVT